ncbi:MAG: hypothetical protein LAO30_04815 [Acidobacteriia bacterium]|nr:hypothetical protein [Terriglobia bacterium]
MNRQKAWIWPFCAVLIVCSFLLPARSWAQDNDSNQDDNWNQDNDPPARVARMNFTQGSVSFQPGGEGDWVDAVPNRPLTTGDNLWTDRGSRAELHVGSTAIRLSSETSLTFLELDDRVMQLRLAQGSVVVRVHHLDDDDTVEIDTPNLAFMVQRNGEYRVDVDPDGRTTVVDVYQGRGEAIGGGNNYTIVANQEASFSGDQDQQLNYDINSLPAPDDFDRWAFDRDRRDDSSPSANYVSPEMTGYEDLDDNGNWSYAGTYGPVWYPTNVPVGWAPYRFGHWVWVAPWGWTWVDDAPWGFAPFHYGRWCQIGPRWAWIPGPVAVRPVYAPALVAFVGGGGFHFSASFGGGGGVAWFPLGPGEVFVPAYHVSRVYVNQVNITNTVVNVTKVTNVYNNYRTNNVERITYVNRTNVTAVSRDTFVNARPVAHNVVAVQQREIEQAPIGRLSGVEPVHGSVMGAGRPTTVAPPRNIINRQVVAQHAPAQPPTPFAQRQDKLLVRPVAPVNRSVDARPQQGSRPEVPINREDRAPNRPEPTINRQEPAPVERSVQQTLREWQAPRPAESPQPERAPEPYHNNMQHPQPRREPLEQPSPQQGWSHPQARPAPPVQPKSESQARDEENKYRNWQQQARPQAARPEPARPQPDKQAPKTDDKKKQR